MSNPRYSTTKTHCILFNDKRKMNITTEEYLALADIISDPTNKNFQLRGAVFRCWDVKFIGSIEDYNKHFEKIPPGQNSINEQNNLPGFNVNHYLKSGKILPTPGIIWDKYTSEQFKTLTKQIWDQHKQRKPTIDKALTEDKCIYCLKPVTYSEDINKPKHHPIHSDTCWKIFHRQCCINKTGIDPCEVI